MKILGKVALGTLAAAIFVGCGEEAKFGDREYSWEYLSADGNEKLLVEIVQFCEANQKAKLSSIQMKNCATADQRKRRLSQKWGDADSHWEELVKQYGKK